jgi:hypothetical protein
LISPSIAKIASIRRTAATASGALATSAKRTSQECERLDIGIEYPADASSFDPVRDPLIPYASASCCCTPAGTGS